MNTEALFSAAKAGDPAAMEALVTGNAGLVWSIARRYFGRGTEPDDLYQLGCVGLIKAIQGFDPAFGTQFSTYAVPKIAGEIRRFLRDDGPIKVSRTVKDAAWKLSALRTELANTLGREPLLSELSEKSGLPPEELAALETATAGVTSLQAVTGEDGLTLESILGDEGIEDQLVEKTALRDAMAALPERERCVVGLRYFRELTQEKVARCLGVSQVQVSRLERRALGKLRDRLQNSG